MKDAMRIKKLYVTIGVFITCFFLTSCRNTLSEDKRIEVILSIAETVNASYKSEDLETPLFISMIDVEKLLDGNSDLYKTIEKYDDIKQHKVYLIDNNVVIIVTDIVFQGAKGFIVSNEELNGVLEVPGLGFDADSPVC